ncbi:MAG: DUF4389 domain-containing protein [Thiothrix sp.]|nr:DUF4389 domain-containing protein [Thiothrix sp.]HPQ96402.1 DUF4389 domain-containing protein [Thiolinea sp.]
MTEQAIPENPSSRQSGSQPVHYKDRSTWIRILYMLLFAFIYGVTKFALNALVLIQIALRLLTGEINDNLRTLSSDLSQYIYDMLRFMTFNSERKPFPFAEWKRGQPHD